MLCVIFDIYQIVNMPMSKTKTQTNNKKFHNAKSTSKHNITIQLAYLHVPSVTEEFMLFV